MKQPELPYAPLLATLGASAFAQSDTTAPLLISVKRNRNGEGAVMDAMFNKPTTFEAMNVHEAVAMTYQPASSRTVSVPLQDLPAGRCAVHALHYENMDHDVHMDEGIPTEGYSFAATGPSGLAPEFEGAAVQAGTDAQSVLFMKYW